MVIDTAMAIEDMPKDSGTHAAGVVITKDPVATYVPLTLSKKGRFYCHTVCYDHP